MRTKLTTNKSNHFCHHYHFRPLGMSIWNQCKNIAKLGRYWRYHFGQHDKGPEMAEAARRRVIISGFGVTSLFVILSWKPVGGEWLDWRAGNLSSEVKISAIQAAISGVWEDILLANVPHLNCDILNVEQLKFWNNTIQPWCWCWRWCGDGEYFCFKVNLAN